MTETGMTPRELYDRMRAGRQTSILDIRNRDEFERWAIDGPGVSTTQLSQARVLSASVQGDLGSLVAEEGLDEPVVVVCARGKASNEVAADLRDVGVDAVNLTGGMEAWGDLLVDHDVPSADWLVQFERPATGCLSYLVVSGAEAAVIDPLLACTERYERAATERGATLRWAIDTHVHADHVSGIFDLQQRTEARAVLPAGSSKRGLQRDARLVDDGDCLQVGDRSLEIVYAPGHTSELCVLECDPVVLTGDALFVDSVGRPDLEEGGERAEELAGRLFETLTEGLLTRVDDTVVAPGHANPDTQRAADGAIVAPLSDVRSRLSLAELGREAFIERLTADASPRPANYERIVQVNLGSVEVDNDTARELELGPNNCSVALDAPEA